MRVGTDIIEVERFREILLGGDVGKASRFLEQNFHPEELMNKKPEHLAGIFAAKEAIFKATAVENFEPLKIAIIADENGRPRGCDQLLEPIAGLDISISHSKNYAVAVAIFVPNA